MAERTPEEKRAEVKVTVVEAVYDLLRAKKGIQDGEECRRLHRDLEAMSDQELLDLYYELSPR